MTTTLPQARFKRLSDREIVIETWGYDAEREPLFRSYQVYLQSDGQVLLVMIGQGRVLPSDWPAAA